MTKLNCRLYPIASCSSQLSNTSVQPGADPDLQLGGTHFVMGVCGEGRSPSEAG